MWGCITCDGVGMGPPVKVKGRMNSDDFFSFLLANNLVVGMHYRKVIQYVTVFLFFFCFFLHTISCVSACYLTE